MTFAGKEGLPQSCGSYYFEKLFVILNNFSGTFFLPGMFYGFTA